MGCIRKKRGVLLLFSFILSALFFFSVSAQGVTLLGNEIPYIVLVPVAIIVLGVLFFSFLSLSTLFSALKKKIKARKSGKKKDGNQEILEKKAYYEKEINLLAKKVKHLEPKDSAKEISILARNFFGYIFHIPTQYSYEELQPKLKEHSPEQKLANELSNFVYGGAEINKHQAEVLLSELAGLMSKHLRVKSEVIQEKRGFFLFSLFRKKQAAKAPEIGKKEEKKPELKTGEKSLIDLLESRDERKELLKAPEPCDSKVNLKSAVKKKEEELQVQEKPTGWFSRKIEEHRNRRKKQDILDLLKFGRKYMKEPEKAMRVYSKALLLYYKLPLAEEKEILDDMAMFEEEMSFNREQKKLVGIKENLAQLKKDGKAISHESLSAIKNLASLIEDSHFREQEFRKKQKAREMEKEKGGKKVERLVNIPEKLKEHFLDGLDEELKVAVQESPLQEDAFLQRIKVPEELPTIKIINPIKKKIIKLPMPPKEKHHKITMARQEVRKSPSLSQSSSFFQYNPGYNDAGTLPHSLSAPVPPRRISLPHVTPLHVAKSRKRELRLQKEKQALYGRIKKMEGANAGALPPKGLSWNRF
jgi:hypothetical protein